MFLTMCGVCAYNVCVKVVKKAEKGKAEAMAGSPLLIQWLEVGRCTCYATLC